MNTNKFVDFNGSRLHYATAGHGTKHLLIFHGFGQDLSVFQFLTQSLARHYTFYVFDLYFHGSSVWAHDESALSKLEWRDTISKFLTENNINRFSLGAFSMGGKFALTTIEFFSNRVDEVTLIAPDGIKTNVWYNLATYPFLLRKFFKSMILHPDRFINVAHFLNRWGFVDKGLIRFSEYQMGSVEKRKRVYYSWVVFRKLKPDLNVVAQALNTYSIKFTLIAGKYDKVIKPQNMITFLKGVRNYNFEILESGHHGLINQSVKYFIF